MELLTVEETARILRVSQVTVRRYLKAGVLTPVRMGRTVRIERDAVEQLGRVQSGEPEADPGMYAIRRTEGSQLMIRDDRGTYNAFEGPVGAGFSSGEPQGVILTVEHPIWRHLGMASEVTGAADVSEHKGRYLTDGYQTHDA